MVIAAFPTLPTVGTILGITVIAAGVAWVFIVKGYASALDASQETVKVLTSARLVEKEARETERAKWELAVEVLEAKVLALEATVASLRGEIVQDLLREAKAALASGKKLKASTKVRRRRG